MFRKPKRKVQNLRRKDEEDDPKDDDDDDDEQTTGELLNEAKKRAKPRAVEAASSTKQTSVMHSYDTSKGQQLSNADLATRTAEHHAVAAEKHDDDKEEQQQQDGIFRNKQQNKFLAGPIRAAQHVRVTARFDYQPDICKDYKDTGFCGFGDTCIYLHDRGDTMTGWQLEQQWEKEQREKKEKQEKEMTDFLSTHSGGTAKGGGVSIPDDGLPFACHICRKHFTDPVVTACNHYFCEKCIMDHVRSVSEACPICNADTSSVFNQPTKLIVKKRRVVGAKASWEDYYKAVTGKTTVEE